jgi:hypothetical protein
MLVDSLTTLGKLGRFLKRDLASKLACFVVDGVIVF